MNEQQTVTAEALAAKWSGLLNQAFISIITLEAALAQRDEAIAKLTAEIEALRGGPGDMGETKRPPG